MNLVDLYNSSTFFVIARNISKTSIKFYGYNLKPGEAIVTEEGAARTFNSMLAKGKLAIIPYHNNKDSSIIQRFVIKSSTEYVVSDHDGRFDFFVDEEELRR